MNPKEKEAEKELNSQETENIAEEQLQEETTDQEAPLTKEEELEKELEKANETKTAARSLLLPDNAA